MEVSDSLTACALKARSGEAGAVLILWICIVEAADKHCELILMALQHKGWKYSPSNRVGDAKSCPQTM